MSKSLWCGTSNSRGVGQIVSSVVIASGGHFFFGGRSWKTTLSSLRYVQTVGYDHQHKLDFAQSTNHRLLLPIGCCLLKFSSPGLPSPRSWRASVVCLGLAYSDDGFPPTYTQKFSLCVGGPCARTQIFQSASHLLEHRGVVGIQST